MNALKRRLSKDKTRELRLRLLVYRLRKIAKAGG
jgi:hypothetical protein